jgi:hypothetical protein
MYTCLNDHLSPASKSSLAGRTEVAERKNTSIHEVSALVYQPAISNTMCRIYI